MDAAHAYDGPSLISSDGGLVSDGESGDGSCILGTVGSFATQGSLDLFGQTVYYADGGTLPQGRYRLRYLDGCMKYNAGQDWTVNAVPPGTTGSSWWIVNGPGGVASTALIVVPPGTAGTQVGSGGYAQFADCVAANQAQDTPRDFDYDGGPLGVWLLDDPYSDNVAGDNGDNPKWSLELLQGTCPVAQ
jgi:hypothetical protein